MTDKPKTIAPTRTAQWLDRLDQAGPDEAAAKAVLNEVRDDPKATTGDREEFYQSLAQQSFVWYLEALRGKPYTPEEMQFLIMNEVKKELGEAG